MLARPPGLTEKVLATTRWKVNDLAIDTDRFRRPHGDGADERQSWQLLRSQVVSLQ